LEIPRSPVERLNVFVAGRIGKMPRHNRLILMLTVATGYAILGTGCESKEIRAARLDAEAKWAAALEARAAIPTGERIESARHALALAKQEYDAAFRASYAVYEEAVDEALAAGNAARTAAVEAARAAREDFNTRQTLARAAFDAAYFEFLDAASQAAGVATEAELKELGEATRLAEQELEDAESEREIAISLAQTLTVAAEEATAFLEAGRRAQR